MGSSIVTVPHIIFYDQYMTSIFVIHNFLFSVLWSLFLFCHCIVLPLYCFVIVLFCHCIVLPLYCFAIVLFCPSIYVFSMFLTTICVHSIALQLHRESFRHATTMVILDISVSWTLQISTLSIYNIIPGLKIITTFDWLTPRV